MSPSRTKLPRGRMRRGGYHCRQIVRPQAHIADRHLELHGGQLGRGACLDTRSVVVDVVGRARRALTSELKVHAIATATSAIATLTGSVSGTVPTTRQSGRAAQTATCKRPMLANRYGTPSAGSLERQAGEADADEEQSDGQSERLHDGPGTRRSSSPRDRCPRAESTSTIPATTRTASTPVTDAVGSMSVRARVPSRAAGRTGTPARAPVDATVRVGRRDEERPARRRSDRQRRQRQPSARPRHEREHQDHRDAERRRRLLAQSRRHERQRH